LITPDGLPVTIDFDDLTLAPFGYDLAKLVVTLAMTYGELPGEQIAAALFAYNTDAARQCAAPRCGPEGPGNAESQRCRCSGTKPRLARGERGRFYRRRIGDFTPLGHLTCG